MRKRFLLSVAACSLVGPALAQDVVIPGGVAKGAAAVGAGVMVAKGGKFCLRHPALCAMGAVTGLAVGGVVLAHKMKTAQPTPCAGPGACPP